MRKRNAKILTLQLGAARVLASDYGPRSKALFATADERNVLTFWTLGNQYPVSSCDVGRTDSQISFLRFGAEEKQVVLGSSRGLISVWDIGASKTRINLKGHNTTTTSLATTTYNTNFLASGSYDLKIKLWDLRSKDCTGTLMGHDMEIVCMEVSPAGRFLVSGAKDSTARLWDLRQGNRLLHIYTQESPVNCLQFNPDKKLFATGGFEAKHWEIADDYSCLNSTGKESTPVTALLFLGDGDSVFTASNNSLKLWSLQEELAVLTDNIESAWKGVHSLFINEQRKALYGLATYQKEFALFECKFDHIAFDGKKIDFQRLQNQSALARQREKQAKEKEARDAREAREKEVRQRRARQQQERREAELKREEMERALRVEEERKEQERREQRRAQIEQLKQEKASREEEVEQHDDTFDIGGSINFSKLISGGSNSSKDVFAQIDLINEIGKDHSAVMHLLSDRVAQVKPLGQWLESGNLKQYFQILEGLTKDGVVLDCLRAVLQSKTLREKVTVESAMLLVRKCTKLIENTNVSYIKWGLTLMLTLVDLHRDELIQTLSFAAMGGGVDLAREQRLQKYRDLAAHFDIVLEHSRLKHILRKEDHSRAEKEAAELVRRLVGQLELIRKRTRGEG